MPSKKISIIFIFLYIIISFYIIDKNDTVFANVRKIENDTKISSKNYLLEESYIKLVKEKTNKTNFINNFNVTNATLNIDCNNTTNYVGTACLLQMTDTGNNKKSYSIIVPGDVNGDGKYTITDIVKIALHSNDKTKMNKKEYIMAADFDNNDKVDLTDINSLAYHTIVDENFEFLNNPTVIPEIELLTKTLILSKGASSNIEIKISNNDISIIDWQSSDEKIVTVDNTGMVTAIGAGEATITIKSSKGDTASMHVNVYVSVLPTGVSLNDNKLTLGIDETKQLKATISPEDSTKKEVTWKSSDTDVATVDKNGLVKAISKGTATITATTVNGKTATTTVTVTENFKLNISKSSVTLIDGSTTTLTAKLSQDSINDQSVTWKSNDTSIATINENGKVTAKSTGKTTITATSNYNPNISAECTVTVRKAKYLFVGNSKTYYPETESDGKGIPLRFMKIAENAGYEIEYTMAVRHDSALNSIIKENNGVYNYPELVEKIKNKYDYVVLQEGTDTSFKYFDTYKTSVSTIKNWVEEKKSNVKIYLRKTWVRKNTDKTDIETSYANAHNIVDSLNLAGTINDGPVFYDVINNYKNIDIIPNDLVHQNDNGAYLAALCIFSEIYDKDPTAITYKDNEVSDENADTLKKLAKKHCYNN